MLHFMHRMNVRFSSLIKEEYVHLARVAANWGKWSTTIAISPFDLFEGRDVGIALFLLLKVPIIERARLNRKSIDDIAAVDWTLVIHNCRINNANVHIIEEYSKVKPDLVPSVNLIRNRHLVAQIYSSHVRVMLMNNSRTRHLHFFFWTLDSSIGFLDNTWIMIIRQ